MMGIRGNDRESKASDLIGFALRLFIFFVFALSPFPLSHNYQAKNITWSLERGSFLALLRGEG